MEIPVSMSIDLHSTSDTERVIEKEYLRCILMIFLDISESRTFLLTGSYEGFLLSSEGDLAFTNWHHPQHTYAIDPPVTVVFSWNKSSGKLFLFSYLFFYDTNYALNLSDEVCVLTLHKVFCQTLATYPHHFFGSAILHPTQHSLWVEWYMDAHTGAIIYLLKFSWLKILGPERDSNDNSLVVECEVDRGILDAKASEESWDLI